MLENKDNVFTIMYNLNVYACQLSIQFQAIASQRDQEGKGKGSS